MNTQKFPAQLVLIAATLEGKSYLVNVQNPQVAELLRENAAQAAVQFNLERVLPAGMYVWEGDLEFEEVRPVNFSSVVPLWDIKATGALRRATLPDLAKCARW